MEVGLWLKRSLPFVAAIWLPIITLTTTASFGIAALYLDIASQRSGPGDMSGLGFVIDFVFLSPWLIAFVGAVISRPVFRLQSKQAWLTGTLISGAMMGGIFLYGMKSEVTKFVILNPDGEPIPNRSLLVLSSYYSDPHIASTIVTGNDGTFTLWLSPGKSFFIEASGGALVGEVRIWNQQDYLVLPGRSVLNVYCDWDTPGEPERGIYPVSFSIGQEAPVSIILKSKTSLTSPYVRKLVQEKLTMAREGNNSLNLAQLVSNPEALEQLDLISEVMDKQPTTRPAIIEGLRWSGKFVVHAKSATNSFYYYHGGQSDPFPSLLGKWLELAPAEVVHTPGNVTSPFRQKVDALGFHLIQTLSPYFGSQPGASTVIQEMGVEGRPALDFLAQSFPNATQRCQDQILWTLPVLKPTVSDLSWLLESKDPHLVLAGYAAVTSTIKPEERDLAKEKVDAALAIAKNPADLNRGRILSASLDRGVSSDIFDKGVAAFRNGDDATALLAFNRAILLDSNNANAYANRGIIFVHQGENAKALADYNKAIELDPYNSIAYGNRGVYYGQERNYELALQDLNKSMELNSSDPAIYYDRALAFHGLRQYARALIDLDRAMGSDPKNNVNVYNEAAWILATAPQDDVRNGKKAVAFATQACETSNWHFYGAIDTLAAAYAEVGDFDNALKWENKYLESPNQSADDIAQAKSRLILYQSRQPFRDQK